MRVATRSKGRKVGRGRSPRAYFTSSKGRRFYARAYGYKAWPIGQRPVGKS